MNPNETSQTNQGSTPAGAPGNQEKSIGAIIGILIVVAIIIIGGLYFWGQRIIQSPESDTGAPAAVEFQPTESTSSEITDIEADLSATVLDGLDSEIDTINAELGI